MSLPPGLSSLPRHVFFTGKGGVGKTSLSCATAIALAKLGHKVFLVSTDPASNLNEMLGLPKLDLPTPLPAVPGLTVMNIDPTRAGQLYRERALAPLKGTVPEATLKRMEEAMSGACTMEVAAFDEFAGLFQDEDSTEAGGFTAGYDHVVFDTAPTGHTLRLLSLPAAWNSFLDHSEMGNSCLGPSSAMKMNHSRFNRALQCLTNASSTVVILVARPDGASLKEAARSSLELAEMNLKNQKLVINGVFQAMNPSDEVAMGMQTLGQQAIANMAPALKAIVAAELPLQPFNMIGLERLCSLFDQPLPLQSDDVPPPNPSKAVQAMLDTPLAKLVDEIAAPGNGLVLVMGKGGVGKTTTAACIAVELATRGYPVHLSTTDPAAHLADTLAGDVDGPLTVSRIDPRVETEAYIADIMAKYGASKNEKGRALMLEDLRSPCTEEVAVFQAFHRVISQCTSRFVILDTAPTGHTLLLLDQTGAYHKETLRVASGGAAATCCAPGAPPGSCGPAAEGAAAACCPSPAACCPSPDSCGPSNGAPTAAVGCCPSPDACGPSNGSGCGSTKAAASAPSNGCCPVAPAPTATSASGCAPGACAPGTCGPPVPETAGPTPLEILRDTEKTKILLVTLPETTPISEAAALQEDLRRAGVEPFGWVVNSALSATATTDPLLRYRAAAECEQLERLGRDRLTSRVALMPFALERPVTPPLLLRQVWNGARPPTAEKLTTEELMERYISRNPVVVFSVPNCVFCDNARNALDSVGARYWDLDIKGRPDTAAIKAWFKQKSGSQTVPRVFVGGNCIGGGSDAKTLAASGELRKIVEAAGGLRATGAELAQNLVAKHPVVVFALKNCSFCTKAITALDSVGARYEVLVVSDRPDKEEIRAWLATAASGSKALPKVFVGGRCIGGGDDTHALAASGELHKMVVAAGASTAH